MKKMMAGIILVSIMLTGCGNVDELADHPEYGASVEDSAVETEEQNSPTESESDIPQELSYEDALRMYFEAANNQDYDQIIRWMYPNKIVDGVYTINKLDSNILAEEFNITNTDADYQITDMIQEASMSDEELELITGEYGMMLEMIERVENYGGDVDALTDEQREEIYGTMLDLDKIKENPAYTITEGYDVTVRYLNHGKPDEDYFYVYYIEDEGWKFNNSMRKYVKIANQSAANANAKSLFNACATTFIELDMEGIDLSGSYLISSDDSRNVNVPSFVDVDEVKNSIKNYFSEIDRFDYFVIIHHGACVYSAICKKDGTDSLGSYPTSSIPDSLNDHGLGTEEVTRIDYTLDELYDIAKGVIS